MRVNELDLGIEQCIENRHDVVAGQREHPLYTGVLQNPRDRIGTTRSELGRHADGSWLRTRFDAVYFSTGCVRYGLARIRCID